MLWTDERRTTESSVRWPKLQTWQVGLSHSGALRLAKLEGKIAAPAKWRTEAWNLLTVERKVTTREGLRKIHCDIAFQRTVHKVCCQWGYKLVFSTEWCKGWSALLQLRWIRPLSRNGATWLVTGYVQGQFLEFWQHRRWWSTTDHRGGGGRWSGLGKGQTEHGERTWVDHQTR